MLNVCLIGYGSWGRLLYKRLIKLSKVIKILNSKNYSLKKLDNIDWIIIATPVNTHYKIVKDCLKLKKNIICEKPLTLKYSQAVKLYNLAEKNNTKIFVSDFSDYKKKIKINKKNNLFQRFKNSKDDNKKKTKRYDLLYRLAYHDISYIYNYIYKKKIDLIKILTSKPFLKFIIKVNNKNFIFHYDTLNKKKIHVFNEKNLYQNKDMIKKMFIDYIYKKKSYRMNKKKSLYTIKLLEKIKNKIQKTV